MNSFRPPNSGIKPFDPITQERQMADLRRATTPGEGAISRPNAIMRPVMPQVPNQGGMNNFMRLRAMLNGGGKPQI